MKKFGSALLIAGTVLTVLNCKGDDDDDKTIVPADVGQGDAGLTDNLPAPDLDHDAKTISKVHGWPADQKPEAAEGFVVTEFAGGLDNPRNTYAVAEWRYLPVTARVRNLQ